ncbi:MAG: MBL fold metallo-hydrolase, partial [Alphaproteobacteria bacterium]|nr:MBL fold metallo-hydrolase [Alphaproteobacteria bacterium]
PSRDELSEMYRWVRPRIAVPVHGETRHIMEHVRLARALQVPEAVALANGDMLRLAPGPAEVVERVPAGRLAVDGAHLVPLDGGVVQERRRLMHNGAAQVSLALDGDGRLAAPPVVAFQGVIHDPNGAFAAEVRAAVRAAIERLPPRARRDDESLREAARTTLRRLVKAATGRRPVTEVHLLRVDPGAPREAEEEESAA